MSHDPDIMLDDWGYERISKGALMASNREVDSVGLSNKEIHYIQ